MSPRRHIEIAGAGIAGLAAAAAFAQRGHRVRVHERSNTLREIGAGIYLKQNSIEVLRRLGVYESLADEAETLLIGQIRGEGNRLLIERDLSGEDACTVLRGALHERLAQAAKMAGAEILTGSDVCGATPDGTLLLRGGAEVKADLVIGADGVNSQVRETLGLTRQRTDLPDGAIRLLVERCEHDLSGMTYEHWSGACRLGFVPCSPRHVYAFLIGPVAEVGATQVPIDKSYWTNHFPHLSEFIERVQPAAGHYGRHSYVKVRGWHRGRAAIIGDAAHAQPPNLGQGAGMSIANAEALAAAVDANADIGQALQDWESSRRHVSELVQLWSYRYGALGYAWPMKAWGLRASLIRALGSVGPTRRRWGWLWRGGIELSQASSENDRLKRYRVAHLQE